MATGIFCAIGCLAFGPSNYGTYLLWAYFSACMRGSGFCVTYPDPLGILLACIIVVSLLYLVFVVRLSARVAARRRRRRVAAHVDALYLLYIQDMCGQEADIERGRDEGGSETVHVYHFDEPHDASWYKACTVTIYSDGTFRRSESWQRVPEPSAD